MPDHESDFIERPCQSAPGTIRLPYRRYRGTGTARGTCFFLGGGPGMSNLSFRPPEAWLDLMDVVVLEYRGVGKSAPVLRSPHFTKAVLKPVKRLSLAGSAAVADDLARGFADLRSQGAVFDDFGLTSMADDLEALRQQLGLGPVLLVAHSFGTRVAQVMQTRHRASVQGSLLLGSNTAPGLIWFPDEIQAVWRRWLGTQEAENTIGAEVAARLLDGWTRRGRWSASDSRALVTAFFIAFSGQSARQRVLRTMLAAQRGPSAAWWLMARLYSPVMRMIFSWPAFFVTGYVVDGDPTAVARADTQGGAAMFQSPSSLLFSGLDGFFEAGGRREEVAAIDYANTLLVSGEFDTSTPIERWPAEVPEHHKVVLPGVGHTDSLAAARDTGASWLRHLMELPPVAG